MPHHGPPPSKLFLNALLFFEEYDVNNFFWKMNPKNISNLPRNISSTLKKQVVGECHHSKVGSENNIL